MIDYRDWQVPLGRRFRALKLWFVIRHYGIEGLQYHVRRHVQLAQEFAAWVKASRDFELAAPAPLNLVCFAHRAGDEFNRRLLDRVNQTGKLYLSHTVLNGRYTLRLCVGQTHTEAEHVRRGMGVASKDGGRAGHNALILTLDPWSDASYTGEQLTGR